MSDSITTDDGIELVEWTSTLSYGSSSSCPVEVCAIHEHGPQLSCFICMEDFDEEAAVEETVSLQMSCECECWVRVHDGCLNDWFTHRMECPICHQRHPNAPAVGVIQHPAHGHQVNHAFRNYIRRRQMKYEIIIYLLLLFMANIILAFGFGMAAIVHPNLAISFLHYYIIAFFGLNFLAGTLITCIIAERY